MSKKQLATAFSGDAFHHCSKRLSLNFHEFGVCPNSDFAQRFYVAVNAT